jgi:hypothetical protein
MANNEGDYVTKEWCREKSDSCSRTYLNMVASIKEVVTIHHEDNMRWREHVDGIHKVLFVKMDKIIYLGVSLLITMVGTGLWAIVSKVWGVGK